jgi:hypothetical protein
VSRMRAAVLLLALCKCHCETFVLSGQLDHSVTCAGSKYRCEL